MDLLLIVPVLLLSVVVHEVAHAWQALREGDATARDLGRLTLNPLPHLDPAGSFIVPVALHLLPGEFLFGWAKPVPVNPLNYRNPRAGDVRVSLAGIVANLGLVALCALVIWALAAVRGLPGLDGWLGSRIFEMATYGVFINLLLAYFNLMPVPPLDGSHVLYQVLPPAVRDRYRAMGRYGVPALFLTAALFPGVLGLVLSPVFTAFAWIVGVAAG